MIELPVQVPCEICEGLAGRDARYAVIDECEQTVTVVSPWQYEIGQCLVVTRRHVATLLELSDAETSVIVTAARKVARSLARTYRPLGILTYQNNGIYSGQTVPHYHLHVVPRQPGSDWGIGPPQLAAFEDAGRAPGTRRDDSNVSERHRRAQVDIETLQTTAQQIRENLE